MLCTLPTILQVLSLTILQNFFLFPSEPKHIVANPLYGHITGNIVANPVYTSINNITLLQVNTPGTPIYESPDEVKSPAEAFCISTGADWSNASMVSRSDSSPGVEEGGYESLETPRQTQSQSDEPQAYQYPVEETRLNQLCHKTPSGHRLKD